MTAANLIQKNTCVSQGAKDVDVCVAGRKKGDSGLLGGMWGTIAKGVDEAAEKAMSSFSMGDPAKKLEAIESKRMKYQEEKDAFCKVRSILVGSARR